MRTLELIDSQENLVNAYVNDSIGRNYDIESFINLLKSIDGGMSISIDGRWGSGKTFFIKQVKNLLDANNPYSHYYNTEYGKMIRESYQNNNNKVTKMNSNDLFATAYYDAWNHDNDTDPLLSIIYSIMKEAAYGSKTEVTREWTSIIATIGDILTDRNISGLCSNIKGKDIFAEIKDSDNIDEKIKSFLSSLLPEHGNKLVVFIDELDRCSPQYAVKLLERIKHYFNNDNIIFVFSINSEELQHTIKRNYGNEFNACRYLDRFFDLRMTLPPVNKKKYLTSLGFGYEQNIRAVCCEEIIKQMGFELREISKFIPLTKMATYKVMDHKDADRYSSRDIDNGLARAICMGVFVPIAIGLCMYNTTEYSDFINGKDAKWLINILDTEEMQDWVCRWLLAKDESYGNEENKKHVTYKEKINKVYDIVMNGKQDTRHGMGTLCGQACFTHDSRNVILHVTSLLSQYSDYEYMDE